MSNVEDYSSDAPEEFTADQGVQQDPEIRRIQKDNKARVTREGKERRKLWAQRKTKRPPENATKSKEKPEPPETQNQDNESKSLARKGMLPNEVVNFLATRERRVFLSDSEEEKPEVKPTRRRKKAKGSGSGTVVLSDIPPPSCVQNSLEFLKRRKMQVPRSSAVLNNSNQALRLLSAYGVLR